MVLNETSFWFLHVYKWLVEEAEGGRGRASGQGKGGRGKG
jgi:hypothetical protein